MSLDWILFALRLASGVMLVVILAGIFYFLWRDMSTTMNRAESNRRIYGRLIAMVQFDDIFTPTGETYPLRSLTSFGRSPTSSVVLKDEFASSEHATISFRDGRWWLEDRHSRNGTMLNGERITTPVIITDGDILNIGNTHFRIIFDLAESS